jgi:hypothetical protein
MPPKNPWKKPWEQNTQASSSATRPGPVMSTSSQPAQVASSANTSPVPTSNTTSGILRVNLQDAPALTFGELPTPERMPQESQYSPGAEIPENRDIVGRVESYEESLKYPARANFRQPKSQKVLTNHFEMEIEPDTVFYEYRITGMPENLSKAVKRLYLETAIENVPLLKENKASFATNKVDTIIAWVNLLELAGSRADNERESLILLEVTNRDAVTVLELQFIREVDFGNLKAFSNVTHSDPSAYDPEPALNALNILITKCFDSNDKQLLYLNAHKFYVKNRFKDLTKPGTFKDVDEKHKTHLPILRALRGCSYRVKLGMNQILLNVNPAMSAFWKPLKLNEALDPRRTRTFNEGENALRGVRVYIDYERGETKDSDINKQHLRIGTIRSFGLPVGQQKFKRKRKDAQGNVGAEESITVQDYLKESELTFPYIL